jgi:PAS domain S-box-containing protein
MQTAIWPIIDDLPVSFYFKDTQSRFVYLNRATATSLGIDDPNEALGKTDLDFFERNIADAWMKEEQDIMGSRIAHIDRVEREILQAPHKPAPLVITRKMALRDSSNTIMGLVGVTQRIPFEKQLMIEHVSFAVDSAEDGLWYRNYLTDEAWYSSRWKAMLGYAEDEIPNKRDVFLKMVHPDDLPSVKKACNEHMAGRTPFYEGLFRMKHRDGTWRWIHARGKARIGSMGKPEEFAGSHSDITSYQVVIDLNNEILRMLPVLVFLKDKNRAFEYVNKKVEEYLNRSPEEIIGKTHEEVDPNEKNAQRFREDDERILKGLQEELFIPDELLTNQMTGQERRLQTRKRSLLFPITDPQPHVLGVSTDITDLVTAKENLRILRDSLAAKLKALTALALDIEESTSEKDACDTTILRLQEVGSILGYASVMISFKTFVEGRPCIVAERDYATGLWKEIAPHTKRWCDVPRAEMDILPLVLEDGKAEFIRDSRIHVACDQGLSKKYNCVSQYVIPLHTPSLKIGTLQIAMGEREHAPDECSFYDAIAAHLSVAIERHRRLAELEEKNARLNRTSKLVAWSAAGTVVIHELKHALTNFFQVLKRAEHNSKIRSNEQAMDFLKDTRRFMDHWGALFENHLQSARITPEHSTASPEKSISEVCELVQPKAKAHGCKVVWKDTVATRLWVSVSNLYLEEMISVLVSNAIDAHAKTVRIEAKRVEATLPFQGQAHAYAKISVCDDGHGIAAEYQDQVGKFGWTSKKAAGHGVGLTIVATLAEAFEGGLSLASGGRSVGRVETVFDLYLPVL